MNRIDFNTIFLPLMSVYEVELNRGQQDSYFEVLKALLGVDFADAAKRLPATELKTHYKPFPTAPTIKTYVESAREARILDEKASRPRDLDEVYRRTLTHNHTPEQEAFQKLCYGMYKAGGLTAEAKRLRIKFIEAFTGSHRDWLSTREELREFLATKLQEAK
jgi:hypothetical protein